MLSFLDVVPNQFICHPQCLLPGYVLIPTGGIMADGEPLSALSADNSFHRDSAGGFPGRPFQAYGNAIRFHQRGSRR